MYARLPSPSAVEDPTAPTFRHPPGFASTRSPSRLFVLALPITRMAPRIGHVGMSEFLINGVFRGNDGFFYLQLHLGRHHVQVPLLHIGVVISGLRSQTPSVSPFTIVPQLCSAYILVEPNGYLFRSGSPDVAFSCLIDSMYTYAAATKRTIDATYFLWI